MVWSYIVHNHNWPLLLGRYRSAMKLMYVFLFSVLVAPFFHTCALLERIPLKSTGAPVP